MSAAERFVFIPRCVPWDQFEEDLETIGRRFADERIMILESNPANFDRYPQGYRVLQYRGTRFKATQMRLQLLGKVDWKACAAVVIPLTNYTGRGFEELTKFALRRRRVPSYYLIPSGDLKPLPPAAAGRRAAAWTFILAAIPLLLLLTLVSLVAHLLLLAANLVGRVLPRNRPPGAKYEPAGEGQWLDIGFCVISNGEKDPLERVLEAAGKSIEHYGSDVQLYMSVSARARVDTGGRAGGRAGVKVIEVDKPSASAKRINRIMKATKEDIVIVLRDNVVVSEGFVTAVADRFSGVAGVAIVGGNVIPANRELRPLGRPELLGLYMRGGALRFKAYDIAGTEERDLSTACVEPAAFAVSRKVFDRMKGFDVLFTDEFAMTAAFCYRAWKSGAECRVAAGARALALAESRPGRGYDENRAALRREYNLVLMEWTCLSGIGGLLRRMLGFPRRLLKMSGRRGTVGVLEATAFLLARLPGAIWRRITNSRLELLNDSVVIDRIYRGQRTLPLPRRASR